VICKRCLPQSVTPPRRMRVPSIMSLHFPQPCALPCPAASVSLSLRAPPSPCMRIGLVCVGCAVCVGCVGEGVCVQHRSRFQTLLCVCVCARMARGVVKFSKLLRDFACSSVRLPLQFVSASSSSSSSCFTRTYVLALLALLACSSVSLSFDLESFLLLLSTRAIFWRQILPQGFYSAHSLTCSLVRASSLVVRVHRLHKQLVI
jgi:hypothetical protein